MPRWPERTLRQRFEDTLTPEPNSGCWLWLGSGDGQWGYGRFNVTTAKTKQAHRVAYEMYVGPIPAGLTLDHKCRVVCCVNPQHLEPVTSLENVRRGTSFAVLNAAKTHCDNGHEFTLENTYTRPDGFRSCRACGRQSAAAYRRRRAA